MVMIPEAAQIPVGDMKGPEPVPEMSANLRVARSRYFTSKAGNPCLSVGWIITGPAEVEEYIGRYVFTNYNLTGDGTFRTKEMLQELGFGDDFVLQDDQELIGRECGGTITIEPGVGGYPSKNTIRKHFQLL